MLLSIRFLPREGGLRVCFRRNRHVRGISNTKPRGTKHTLPDFPARTRFAPSPTGYLHLGSLRTALYNFLLARATKGQFILRIEDTDTARTLPDAERRLCEDLRWAGIEWDEGPDINGPYGPHRQSERTKLYREHVDLLLASNNAYRCFCSAERLNELARIRQQLNLPTTYDRACESIPPDVANERAANGEQYTIRLRAPQVYPRYNDLVYGNVGGKAKVNTGGFDDPILLKSDGMPTYHLANVIDDHHMKITHVIRGIEWMPSTPRHLALYKAFNWEPPLFAHVGLLQDAQGQKLSKRDAATDIGSIQRDGVFPEALLNYVALLGWSHKEKSDFLSLPNLIKIFDLKFTKGNTIVSPQKLTYLQKLHGQNYIESGGAQFQDILTDVYNKITTSVHFDRAKIPTPSNKDLSAYLSSILQADAKHFSSIDSFLSRNEAFFRSDLERSTPQSLNLSKLRFKEILESANAQFSQLSESQWLEEKLGDNIQQLLGNVSEKQETNNLAENSSVQSGKATATEINKVLRWAIFAGNAGPPMIKTMWILGRDNTLKRLSSALDDYMKLESA